MREDLDMLLRCAVWLVRARKAGVSASASASVSVSAVDASSSVFVCLPTTDAHDSDSPLMMEDMQAATQLVQLWLASAPFPHQGDIGIGTKY